MSNRLLLAEGDPKSLRVLDVSLRSAGFLVETATTGPDAWAILERELPDVVIAAGDLAAIDGFELCTRLRKRPDGRGLPFILLGADPSVDSKVKGLQVGADEYLVKPVLVNEMVSRVRALVRRRDRDNLASEASPTATFAGKLNDLTPVDLLEVVAAGSRSGIIHLRDLRGSPGTIYFRRGAIVDAEVGQLSGPEAIGRLFSWSQGTFEVEWKNIRRADAIGKPAAELVLDGMRRLDDWNHLAAQLPDMQDVFEVNYRVLAERLAEIPDEVNGVLRLFDGLRSLAHVVEDSLLADLDALGMVIRLRDEGIIRSVSLPKGARSRSWNDARAESAPDESSSRVSTASGAVEQSFANRMAADASGPHPLPDRDATPPGDNVVSPAPMTRTAPGLGQPLADSESELPPTVASDDDGADAVPSPSLEEPNVLHSSDESNRSLPPPEMSADAPPSLPPPDASPQVSPETDSGGQALSPEVVSDAPIPEQVPALHHTQRGMGPIPKPKAAGASTQPPRPVALPGVAPFPASLPSADSPENPASAAQPEPSAAGRTPEPAPAIEAGALSLVEPANPGAPVPPTLILSPPPTDASSIGVVPPTLILPPPRTEADSDGVVPPNQALRAADETVRVSFPDDALSRREALEELGFPGRRRGLRVLGVALAVGVLSAVVVHRLRTKGAAPTESATNLAQGTSPGSSPSGTEPGKHATATSRPASATRTPAAEDEPANQPGGEPAVAKKFPAEVGTDEHPSAVQRPPGAPPTVSGPEPEAARAARAPEPEPSQPASPPPKRTAPEASPTNRTAASRESEAAALHGVVGGKEPGAGDPGKVVPNAASDDGKKVAGDASPKAAPLARAPAEKQPPGTTGNASAAEPAGAPAKSGAPAPDFVHLLSDCRTQFLKNKLRDASATCAAALQTNPRSPDALTLMAHVELNRGHMNKANELAQKAVAIDPRQPDAYVIIGGVHQDSGRIPQAKAAYLHYLELTPHGRYADELRSIVGNL